MASNEARGIGGEKNRRAGELFGLTEPPHRSPDEKLPPPLGAIEESFIQRSTKHAGQDRVDRNSVRRPFDGKRSRERGDPRLAGSVGGHFLECNEGGERSNVDDSTIAFRDHV